MLKNFLVYNLPDNSNKLLNWIQMVEDLPRSPLWAALRDHLVATMEGKPAWLFAGLLDFWPRTSSGAYGITTGSAWRA
jgi:hypothetical protein